MHSCLDCGKSLSCNEFARPHTNTENCCYHIKYCAHCRWLGSRHPFYKNARTINKLGYIVVSNRGKLVYEHRLQMQKFLGRELTKNEHVHHINGVKIDNRIENLQILNSHDHAKTTFLGKHHTPETRFKMSNSKKGKLNPMYGKKPWNYRPA